MPVGFSTSPMPIPTRLLSLTLSVHLSSRHLFSKALHRQIPPHELDVNDKDIDEDDDFSDEESVDVRDEDSHLASPNSANNSKDNSHIPFEHDMRVKETNDSLACSKRFEQVDKDLIELGIKIGINCGYTGMSAWNCGRVLMVFKAKVQNCKTNMNCQSKQIPHTGGSLSLARRKHELEKGGEIVSRGTLWTLTHKRKHDGQYVNLEAEKIAQKIISIEEQDENARILSPQDSLGQVFGSEHNGRVRGIGFGPVPTQVFGQTSYMGSSSSTQIKITRLESELKVERQKVQTLQASQKVMGNVLVSFLRSQGKEVPLELTSLIVSTESDVENAGQESENSFAEQNEEQE
ncbi:hypothetical protein ACFE04_011198 [Oxalis oulophora]